MRILAAIAAACLLAGGCATGGETGTARDVDLTALVEILPTPDGFDLEDGEVRRADAGLIQEALAGTARAESARAFESRGFRDGAIRHWRNGAGATVTVVASRWPDHLSATSIGAGAVDLPLDMDVPGARAWNPSQLRSARGARIERQGATARLLAFAVGDVSLFVRADGALDDDAVIRTIQRLARQLA